MSGIIGKWDLIQKNKLLSHWEFTSDGKFIEDYLDSKRGNNKGTWEIIDDIVALRYENKGCFGALTLEEDKKTAVGEYRHSDNSIHDIFLLKIEETKVEEKIEKKEDV